MCIRDRSSKWFLLQTIQKLGDPSDAERPGHRSHESITALDFQVLGILEILPLRLGEESAKFRGALGDSLIRARAHHVKHIVERKFEALNM